MSNQKQTKSAEIKLRCTEGFKKEVEEYAANSEMDVSTLLRVAGRQYMDRNKRKQEANA